MSFVIQFAYMNEPLNKINKSFAAVFSLEGVLKKECSIVNPVIEVEYENPLTVNYAYIPAFSRYYYIMNTVSVKNGYWRIEMHCDVLKSFSEGILGSPAIIKKSSSNYDMLLDDQDYKCYQKPHTITKKFPQGFNISQASYVLAMLGSKVTS